MADTIRNREWMRAVTRTLLRPAVVMAGWFIKDAKAGSSKPQARAPGAVPGEYLVGFVAGTSEEQARAIIITEGGTLREYYGNAGYGLAVFDTRRPAEDIIGHLRVHKEIRYAEPNFVVSKPEQP